MNLGNTSTNGHTWNAIASAPEMAKARANSFSATRPPAVRMTFDSGGNVGIGTTSPGAPLDVQVASGQSLQFRQDSGLVPGINVNNPGGIPGVMRLRNAMEVWPSDDASRRLRRRPQHHRRDNHLTRRRFGQHLLRQLPPRQGRPDLPRRQELFLQRHRRLWPVPHS